jgi:hypothetical protein
VILFLVRRKMGYLRKASVVTGNWAVFVAPPSRGHLPVARGGTGARASTWSRGLADITVVLLILAKVVVQNG